MSASTKPGSVAGLLAERLPGRVRFAVTRSSPEFLWRAYFAARNSRYERLGGQFVQVARVPDGWRVTEASTGLSLVTPSRMAAERYWRGISRRVDALAHGYGIANLLRRGDTFVDCGAYVGELGLAVRNTGCHYVAVEPDPAAFKVLGLNVPNGTLVNSALWKSSAELEFSVVTDTADSSLVFIPDERLEGIRVAAVPLDELMGELDIDRIRVLKVEAEGAEPEVLEGATKVLAVTDYVAVDCGPERRGNNTLIACHEILQSAEFEFVSFDHLGFHALFRNENRRFIGQRSSRGSGDVVGKGALPSQ